MFATILFISSLKTIYCFYQSQFLPQFGVLIEPEKLVVSYDQVTFHKIYFTIGELTSIDKHNQCPHTNKDLLKHINSEIVTKMALLRSMIPQNTIDYLDDFCSLNPNLCVEGTSTTNPTNIIQDNRKLKKTRRSKHKEHSMPQPISTNDETSVQRKPSSGRNKRFVAPLVAGAGLILSMYSTYKGFSNSEHMDQVEEKYNKLLKDNQLSQFSIHQLHDWAKDFSHKTTNSISHLEQSIKENLCLLNNQNDMSKIQLAMNIFNQDIDSIVNMINGKLDLRIISNDLIHKIITGEDILRDSLYIEEPGILVQSSISSLLSFSNKTNTFEFLIRIPVIKKHMYSPLYKIYNTGWDYLGIHHKLVLPNQFYFYSNPSEKSSHAISYNDISCYPGHGMTICDNSKQFFTTEMRCLNHIIKGLTDHKCDIIFSSLKNDINRIQIYKTNTGVLFSGIDRYKKVDAVGSHYQFMTRELSTNNFTTFIPFQNFSTLVIDDVLITTKKQNEFIISHNVKLDLGVDVDYTTLNLILNKHNQVHLDDLLSSPNLFLDSYTGFHENYSIYLYFELISFVLFILIIWYLWRSNRQLREYKINIGKSIIESNLRFRKNRDK